MGTVFWASPGTRVLGPTSTTEDVLAGIDLQGKRILVTGVSAGLGVETASFGALPRAWPGIPHSRFDRAASLRTSQFSATSDPVLHELPQT
jgi:hypothetical protein